VSNILAIVGRPNVGKSTFFNRLTQRRQAIVEETSGVTRDRHYGKSHWNGKEFCVIDTGGYVIGSDDLFEKEIRKQVDLAIEEADVILFMVDVKVGLTGMDQDVANLLRKIKKPVYIAVNKTDNFDKIADSSEFYQMGLDNIFPISAISGSGTGDLLDEVAKHFSDEAEEDDELPRFAVIGRPNVGKSSLINALLGNDRNIVTDIPGTTRDSIYTPYNAFGFNFLLIDTAGVRKKSKVHEDIEFYSVMRSIRAIELSDVCLLLIDAVNGFESQDMSILQLVEKNRKGIVIVVNKWDLIEKETNTHLEFKKNLEEKLAPFTDIPIIFTSVTEKQRLVKTLELAMQVYKNKTRQIPTAELNEFLQPIIEKTPPPAIKGKYIKIKYITQIKKNFPAFAFFCNFPQYIRDPYKRFLENKIRASYNFTGIPISIFFRKK